MSNAVKFHYLAELPIFSTAIDFAI